MGWLNSISMHKELWPLALASSLTLFFMYFVGLLIGRIYFGTPDSETKGISSLLLGFIVTSGISSFLVCGFSTVLVPILVSIFLGIWTTRFKGQKVSFNVSKSEYVDFAILFASFFLFFLFRVICLLDTETGIWKLMFKDDAWYIEVISGISYFGKEGKPSELLKNLFGYDSYYSPYHYISFSISSFLSSFFRFRSYDLFHFFVCPLFQSLCLFSFYKTSKYITGKTIFSLLIALLMISTLRYSIWDESLNTFLNSSILTKSWIFKNFFGFQFLNSGFGFKFCMSIFLFAIVLENLKRGSQSLLSVFAMLNPIYLVLSGWLSILYLVYDRKKLLKYLLCLIGSMFLFYVFIKAQQTAQNSIDILSSVARAKIILSKGIVSYIFMQYGYFIEYFYNVLFFPAILCTIYRKRLYERFFLSVFLLTPFYSSYFSNKYFTVLFFLFSIGTLSLFFIKNKLNYRLVAIFFTSVIFSVFSQLANIITDLNQIFMFLVFSGFYLLAIDIISKYSGSFFFRLAIISMVLINFKINLDENQFRSIKITRDSNYLEILTGKISEFQISRLAFYDSNCIYPFMNQFFIGEEAQLVSDSIFSTTLRVPKLNEPSAKDQQQFCLDLPISKFLKANLNGKDTLNTTIDFVRQKRIGMISVSNKDKTKLRRLIMIFSDSLENTENKYMMYFRKT